MNKVIKILELCNEFEAKLLSEILTEKKIPHILRSYHESAYDGLWATPTCWGHIEAPKEFEDEIRRTYNEMSEKS
jgi:hypothetical protein